MTALKGNIMICMLTFGLVLALSGCSTTNRTTKQDWEEASRRGTVEAYEQFLLDHPNADQANIAAERVEYINEWSKAISENTTIGYRRFLAKHPKSPYAFLAKFQLARFEQRDWEHVCSSCTKEAYLRFIRLHPKSSHAVWDEFLRVCPDSGRRIISGVSLTMGANSREPNVSEGLAKIRGGSEGSGYNELEISGSFVAMDKAGNTVTIRSGMTKAQLEDAARAAGVTLRKVSDDQWNCGNTGVVFHDGKVARIRTQPFE